MTSARFIKIGKVAGISVLSLSLLLVVASKAVDWICLAPEPRLEGRPEILSSELRSEGDRRILGESWIAKRQGIWQLYLEGDSFAIGWTNAALTSDLVGEQEDSLLRIVDRYVPSDIKKWLLCKYVLIRNRRLPDYVPDEFEMEILGLSRGCKDRHPEIAPIYHRLLNYHAAHDISHAVMDNPLVGCTSFAAWGRHVPDGRLIVGRNFDFEAGRCFDVNKVVVFFRPREGHGFISVAWPAFLGVATGINDQRIYVSISAGHSVDDRTIGIPVCFVVRQVLQYASTLQEAVEIVKEAEVFVSDSFLIADGKTGKALVVEKSPGRTRVRSPKGDYLICSNHFLSEAFQGDRVNLDYIESGTSVARFERMEELVLRAAGELDELRAARILRDRRGKSDLDVGNGNRSTVNPLIATHSVIADVTAGVLWVSAAPHQLGAYVPFSTADFGSAPGEAAIPQDPFLAEGGYAEHLRSKDLLSRGEALLRSGQTAEAKRALLESSALNPGFFKAYLLLGEISLNEGDVEEARCLLNNALGKQPPFRKDRETILDLLRRAQTMSSD